MIPFTIAHLPMFILQEATLTGIIWYISIFTLFIILGCIWYFLLYSKRKEIQLQVPIYPFFQSAGQTISEEITPSLNTNDTSFLYAYLINIDQLTQYEFEEMVAEALKHKGWANIQATSHVNDKGWDIAGLDEDGRLTYIGVKYASKMVEPPIVQKFNTTKSTGRAQRAIIITNSEFTDQAKEYAREVNIELINGQEFRELCQNIIDEAPHSDKLTRPINKVSLEMGLHQFIDRAIFSYPNPPSKFISQINSSKIIFSPFQFYQFSLWQQFANNTR